MPTVVLVTCSALPDGDEDSAALVAALAARGVAARWAVWDDPDVDWSVGLAVVRSTWDYTDDRAAFLAWARSVPRLANPAPVLAWNSDKTYLRDLATHGVPTVPSSWAEPGGAVQFPLAGDFVVKPSVGAGSKGAGRFAADARDQARDHVRHLHEAGRVALVQPYLDEVDTVGETALIYIDGAFSHAVGKAAMLAGSTVNPLDAGVTGSLYVAERITARQPSAQELAVGESALAALRLRYGGDLLYTRVDLLPSPVGPVLVELEVTEPSLFLGHADGAVERYAEAIARRA